MYIYIYHIIYYTVRRPVGVWASKFNSVRFEIRSEAKSEVKRSESELKRRESQSEAKSEAKSKASRSEGRNEARETRLGGHASLRGSEGSWGSRESPHRV